MSNINEIEKQIVGSFETNSLKNKIVEGIKTATEQFGIKLVNGEWIGEGSACALGCMLIAANKGTTALEGVDQGEYEEKAGEMLGVSNEWINAFIYGFDDESSGDYRNQQPEAYDLGTQLRLEFNVSAKMEEDEEDCDEEEEEDYEEEDEDNE